MICSYLLTALIVISVSFIESQDGTCVFTLNTWENYLTINTFFSNLVKTNPDIPCIIWVVADTPYPDIAKDGKFSEGSIADITTAFSPLIADLITFVTINDLKLLLRNQTDVYLEELAFKYNPLEFATSLKPLAFTYIFEVLHANQIIYLDSDVWVTSSISELTDILVLHNRSVVLTVLATEQLPEDGMMQRDINVLRTGIYSGNFVAFRKTPSTMKYLSWWFSKLTKYGFRDYSKGMHLDRIWHEYVPAFFEHRDYYISRDPRHNLAYWTLHYTKDRLKLIDEVPYYDSRPVLFVHMESIREPKDVDTISLNQDRFSIYTLPGGAREVYLAYARMLSSFEKHAARHRIKHPIFYGFQRFTDGTYVSYLYKKYFKEITDEEELMKPHIYTFSPEARELFLSLDIHRHPFSVDQPGKPSMYHWFMRGPYDIIIDLQGRHFFSEIEYAVFSSSSKLQSKFKFPLDRDYWAFKEVMLRLADKFDVSRKLVQVWKQEFRLNLLKALEPPSVEFGINVLGWHKGLFGVGISARCIFDTLKSVNAPVKATLIYGAREHNHKSTYISAGDYTRSAESPINIVVANADNVPGILRTYPSLAWSEHYNIGVWAWELSIYPDKFMANMKHFDELWLPTTFIKDAVASSPLCLKNVPLTVFPFGYPEANFASDESSLFTRERFELRGNFVKGHLLQIPLSTFVFLVVFDYYSYFDRKNPIGAVRAFKEAFREQRDEDILLLIKLNNKNARFTKEHQMLLDEIGDDARVVIIDGHLSDTEIENLHRRSDVYVSLHRSEGFGLNILHAMAAGKITIATDYSGNADFFRKQEVRDAHFPIPYNLIPINGTFDFAPYNWIQGAVWADPIHADTVRAMWDAFYVDTDEHRGKMIRACRSLREDFGDIAVGNRMREHLLLSPYKDTVLRRKVLHPETERKITQKLSQLENFQQSSNAGKRLL